MGPNITMDLVIKQRGMAAMKGVRRCLTWILVLLCLTVCVAEEKAIAEAKGPGDEVASESQDKEIAALYMTFQVIAETTPETTIESFMAALDHKGVPYKVVQLSNASVEGRIILHVTRYGLLLSDHLQIQIVGTVRKIVPSYWELPTGADIDEYVIDMLSEDGLKEKRLKEHVTEIRVVCSSPFDEGYSFMGWNATIVVDIEKTTSYEENISDEMMKLLALQKDDPTE